MILLTTKCLLLLNITVICAMLMLYFPLHIANRIFLFLKIYGKCNYTFPNPFSFLSHFFSLPNSIFSSLAIVVIYTYKWIYIYLWIYIFMSCWVHSLLPACVYFYGWTLSIIIQGPHPWGRLKFPFLLSTVNWVELFI